MDIKKIRELNIAKNQFHLSREIKEDIDYLKWIEFIDNNQNYFKWRENTAKKKETLVNINKIPESFRERVLEGLNKLVCYAGFDEAKGSYDINVGYVKGYNRISINFERTPKIEDLKILLEMANHLDALLLKDGTEIIDEKIIDAKR